MDKKKKMAAASLCATVLVGCGSGDNSQSPTMQPTGDEIAPLPSESSLLEKVQQMVADQAGIPISQVTPKSSLQDLGFDSLDGVELLMNCEDRFDISISDEDVERTTTVEEVVACIEAALRSKK